MNKKSERQRFLSICDFSKEGFTWNEAEELENIPEEFENTWEWIWCVNCYCYSVKYHFAQYQSLVLIVAIQ